MTTFASLFASLNTLMKPKNLSSAKQEKLVDMLWSKQRAVEVKTVCVEISVDFELPHFINVELCDCSFVSIGVKVLWLLMRCLPCRSFIHFGKHYFKKNEVKVWKAKQDGAGTGQISIPEKSSAVRNKSASNGGPALTSTSEVFSKDKAMVLDLSPTFKLKYVCLTRSSNKFEVLSVELENSNDTVASDIDAEQDVVDDDNETEQLEFSPWKPKLALLAVAPLVRSLMATKQENIDKCKKKINNPSAKGREKGGGKGGSHCPCVP
ncbi:hypothetical protein PVK06_034076 [Gossypium arboreum]|uniref:Uncharacterized protein n=1 Tax=Gossypium arboreum TaxID=29729 RepID=A0ABR0ND58_GOSAR|nr:hypothetical protein PVK06_034076 [Gossypium arboreum]